MSKWRSTHVFTGVLVCLVGLTGCLDAAPQQSGDVPDSAVLASVASFQLDGPLGAEPVIHVLPNGTVYVAALAKGASGPAAMHVWVGHHRGTNWTWLGQASPETGTREGDLALAPDGTPFVIEMDATGLAPTCLNLSWLVDGDVWQHESGVCPHAIPTDRPWIAFTDDGTLGVYFRNQNTNTQWLGTRAPSETMFTWQAIPDIGAGHGGRLGASGSAFFLPFTLDGVDLIGSWGPTSIESTAVAGMRVASTEDRGASWQVKTISTTPVASGYGFLSMAIDGQTGVAAHTVPRDSPTGEGLRAFNTFFGPDDVRANVYESSSATFVEGPLLDSGAWNGYVSNAARNSTMAVAWIHAEDGAGDTYGPGVSDLRVRVWRDGPLAGDSDALWCEFADPIRAAGAVPSGGPPFHEFIGLQVAPDGVVYVAYTTFDTDPAKLVVHRIPPGLSECPSDAAPPTP